MSSSSGKSQKLQTCQRTSNFCSTPLRKGIRRPSSISVSAVDTNSSPSIITRQRKNKQQTIAKDPERKQRRTTVQNPERKQRRTTVQNPERKQRRTVENPERKQRRKVKTKPRSKRRNRRANEDDSDWVTKSEQSGDEDANPQQAPASNSKRVLFMDPPSPERVREAHHFLDDRLESPIFQPRQREVESPQKISFGEHDGALPLKDLSYLRTRIDDTDDEDEELSLKREDAVKTYLGLRQARQPKKKIRVEKCKQWLVDVAIPTTTSDYLWDNYVMDHPEEMSMYLAPSTSCKQESSLSVRCGEKSKVSNEEGNCDKTSIEELWPGLKVQRNMDVVSGYWDKSLKKWVRNYDVYRFPEAVDVEFEKNSETGARMTLNEFRRKQKAQKENNEQVASSSSVRNDENIGKKSRNLKDDLKTPQKRKIVCESFKSRSRKPQTVTVDITDRESQTINEIDAFAPILSAKQKVMNSNEISSDKNSPFDLAVASRKRVNKRDTNDTENDGKRQKVTVGNKPKIKFIEKLNMLQYKKSKENWQIIKGTFH